MSQSGLVKRGIFGVGLQGSIADLPKPLQKVAEAVTGKTRPVVQMSKEDFMRSRQGGGK